MLRPAILGAARLGGFRLGYVPATIRLHRSTHVRVTLSGVDITRRVRVEGIGIHDAANDAPNSATLVIAGTPAPVGGQAIRITINTDAPHVLFTGSLATVGLSYQGLPTQLVYPCTAADDLLTLNRRRPFGVWDNISATQVVRDLVAQFAPGVTTVHVAPDLPAISVIYIGEKPFAACLAEVASLASCYSYLEDGDIHLFQGDELTEEYPDPVDAAHPFADDPAISRVSDITQIRTRVYGRGHGEALLCDIPAGETLLPLADVVMFNPAGGLAITGTQRLTYTGLDLGRGPSTSAGPGQLPIIAPSVKPLAVGTGVTPGLHTWAYTWVTAAGETTPSPVASRLVGGPLADPTTAPERYAPGVDGPLGAGVYQWAFTFRVGTSETLPGPRLTFDMTPIAGMNHGAALIAVRYPSIPPNATEVRVYRTAVNGSQLKFVTASEPNYYGFSFTDNLADSGLGFNAPTVNTTAGVSTAVQVLVAWGPAAVTARKVYRTVAGGTQLKLAYSITASSGDAGNIDTVPDSALGANAPIADTAGLAGIAGRVNAGATSLITAGGRVVFNAAGGWIQAAGQLIRYAGMTDDTLTGIPATGAGAIISAIAYSSVVSPVPVLRGVTGVLAPLLKDALVNIWVQVDDVVAQAAMAAVEPNSDGIYENLIADERRGEASLMILCAADLVLFAYPIVTVQYATRDVKTKSGKPVVISLASPPISEILTIQDVAVSEIDRMPGVPPRFTVTASSVRFSLEDILRRLTAALGITT